jgi:hypothetical protein
MSYGPGRYDRSYEEGGLDYPYDYVRWTEGRNIESVLDLVSSGKVNVRSLTTHRFPLEKAPDAYQVIEKGSESYIGILLDYDLNKPQQKTIRWPRRSRRNSWTDWESVSSAPAIIQQCTCFRT